MSKYSKMKPKEKVKFTACCGSNQWAVKLFVFHVILGVVCGAVFYTCKFTLGVSKPTPVIMTLNGPVQGNVQYSRDGQEYWQFLGIPYAKPPIEELLFQPPVPVGNWKDVKQVTTFTPGCSQFEIVPSLKISGEMDCLNLNVFVNVANKNASKPVLVYIHGGGFMIGGSYIYHPELFMDYEVVVVAMNYRVGPYGFLDMKDFENSTEDNLPKGNMGLMDQQLALTWVQRNIASFGGDPNRVTLFGESAGAISTNLHIFTPSSTGLFQRAILQSGSALTPYTISGKPKEVAIEYAKRMKCPNTERGRDILECFKSVKWEDFVIKQLSLMEPLHTKDAFEPTIDGTFLKDSPTNLLKSGNFTPVPIMIGLNSGEGVIRSARFGAMPELVPELDKNWSELLHNVLILDDPVPADISKDIREYYFGISKFSEDTESFLMNLTLAISDAGFFYPSHVSAIYHAKKGAPTYLYYFNYTSRIYPSLYSVFGATRLDDWLPGKFKTFCAMMLDSFSQYIFDGAGTRKYGISHGESALQLWNLHGWSKYNAASDSDFSHSFLKSIVDFANNTIPLTFREITWPSINNHVSSGGSEYTIPYMLMDNEDTPKVISDPFKDRLKFWADIMNRLERRKYWRF